MILFCLFSKDIFLKKSIAFWYVLMGKVHNKIIYAHLNIDKNILSGSEREQFKSLQN